MTLLSSSEKLEIQYMTGVVKINILSQKNAKQIFVINLALLRQTSGLALSLIIGNMVLNGSFQKAELPYAALIMGIVSILGILISGLIGLFYVHLLFWRIAGLEALEIRHDVLKIKKSVFGIGTTKEYNQDKITNIELVSEKTVPFGLTRFNMRRFEITISGPILINLKDEVIETFTKK